MTISTINRADSPSRTPDPKLAALAAASIVLVAVLFVDNNEREQIMGDEHLHVAERLSAVRAKLEANVNGAVAATRSLAIVYAAHHDLTRGEFVKMVQEVMLPGSAILNIGLIRHTTVDYVHPAEGNENLVGVDFRNVPSQWPMYQQMMTSRTTVIAGPMQLVQGGTGIIVRIPVFRRAPGGDKFIGAINAPMLLDRLLREAGVHDIEETMHMAIRGRDGKGSGGSVFYGDPKVFAMNPVVQNVNFSGGQWEIAAYPRSGWGATSQTVTMIRLLGVAICLLAAFWAYEMARHLQLRTENEQRLRESEARLKLHDSALNVAANAIVISDREARIVWANQAFTKLTGYELDEAIGRHCGELVKSGHHDRQFYAEMWQTILSGRVWHGELINRRKDGTLYHDEMTITPVRGKDNEITHFVALKQDITARKIGETQLKNLAFHDPLTQLPNRRLLIDRLGQTLAASKRSGRYGALMFLDLDNFKPLNDEHGHDIGDLLLIEVARRIVSCVREEDTVARFGGDEFVVILKELDADKAVSTLQANGVAEKIRAALAEPYRLELLQAENDKTTIEHSCTSSIGVVLFVNPESGEEEIIKWADGAMYQAKAAGRNTIRFYGSDKTQFAANSL